MLTISRAPALLLLVVVPAVSACGSQAGTPLMAQPALSAASVHVRCRTLDYAKDSSANQLNGIDNRGEIAGSGTPAGGYVTNPPYRQNDFRAENYPGGFATYVAGANDTRIIVGFYRDGKGDTEGFVNVHGRWTGVKSNSNLLELLGINAAGRIVGFYADRYGVDHAFEIPFLRIKPPGGISDVAAGINKGGHIVGYMTIVSGAVEGFLFKGGAYSDLSYPGSTNTAAFGINSRDEIVGSYSDSSSAIHGFLLTSPRNNPHWESFDEPQANGFTRISGINDSGEFVGSYLDATGVMHGFLCR